MPDNDNLIGCDTQPSEVPELPQRALTTYARLWQLEIWLRRMVYVELRALKGDDWSEEVGRFDKPFEADKRLSHMPTPEEDPLSYAPFSELQRIISEKWNLFSPYLPPKNIWQARLEEVSQVRNRVAHFRKGHSDDPQRVLQLLRDIDRGFWIFCTSYNDSQPILPATDDPVTGKFLEFDPFPYREVGMKTWARVGHADSSMVYAVTVECLRRPWAATAMRVEGVQGYLYDVNVAARNQRTYDYLRFLEGTRGVHRHLVYLCLDRFAGSVRLTIPAILGAGRVIEIIERVIDVTKYTIRPSPMLGLEDPSVQHLSEEWPEYILGPDNPLTFLSPEMPCAFFNV